MTYIARDQVETLNYIAEDISNARRTARLAAEHRALSTEQFMYQQRQLDRALEALAAFRETLAVAADTDSTNAVITIAAVAA